MKCDRLLFSVTCFILVLFSYTAYGLTFTLSDDAIMALDFNEGRIGVISKITDVPGPGVRFDIVIHDTRKDSLVWTSSINGGQGILTGRDISMFDAFALKFTLLSARSTCSSGPVGPVIVGSMITQSHYLWDFNPEIIELNDQYNPASAVSAITTDGAGQINLVGFTCYIPYWLYDETGNIKGAILSILVEPAPDAVVMSSDPNEVLQVVSLDKCTVAAGRREGRDKISFSGKMNPVYDDLCPGNVIRVAVSSNDMPDPCVITIPIKNANFKKTGKFGYHGTDENGVRRSFRLNFKTNRFSFAARNLNLTGLSCKVRATIDINDYNAETHLDEAIVNGPKRPIPINLLMGVRNSIRVDKLNVKYSSKPDTNSMTIKGGFSVLDVDVNMAASPFSVSLGGQVFTIPANKFKLSHNKYYCSKVKLDGYPGLAWAVFDFNRGTFAITIKNTTINESPGSTPDLVITFKDFAEGAEVFIPYP
jgi:hypothetical protein